ncbi:MAG: SURF1 family protein, partial [Pseudomonadota bacterium]
LRVDEIHPSTYQVKQQLVKFGPERHIGYAVQWFSLTLALFVIFIVVNTKKVASESRPKEK